ncbi:MAG: hypothetical protein P8008_07105 [Gammaproteobacteria bacterium]
MRVGLRALVQQGAERFVATLEQVIAPGLAAVVTGVQFPRGVLLALEGLQHRVDVRPSQQTGEVAELAFARHVGTDRAREAHRFEHVGLQRQGGDGGVGQLREALAEVEERPRFALALALADAVLRRAVGFGHGRTPVQSEMETPTS